MGDDWRGYFSPSFLFSLRTGLQMVSTSVGNLNELYQSKFRDPSGMEGTNAVYKAELAGGNTAGVR